MPAKLQISTLDHKIGLFDALTRMPLKVSLRRALSASLHPFLHDVDARTISQQVVDLHGEFQKFGFKKCKSQKTSEATTGDGQALGDENYVLTPDSEAPNFIGLATRLDSWSRRQRMMGSFLAQSFDARPSKEALVRIAEKRLSEESPQYREFLAKHERKHAIPPLNCDVHVLIEWSVLEPVEKLQSLLRSYAKQQGVEKGAFEISILLYYPDDSESEGEFQACLQESLACVKKFRKRGLEIQSYCGKLALHSSSGFLHKFLFDLTSERVLNWAKYGRKYQNPLIVFQNSETSPLDADFIFTLLRAKNDFEGTTFEAFYFDGEQQNPPDMSKDEEQFYRFLQSGCREALPLGKLHLPSGEMAFRYDTLQLIGGCDPSLKNPSPNNSLCTRIRHLRSAANDWPLYYPLLRDENIEIQEILNLDVRTQGEIISRVIVEMGAHVGRHDVAQVLGPVLDKTGSRFQLGIDGDRVFLQLRQPETNTETQGSAVMADA